LLMLKIYSKLLIFSKNNLYVALFVFSQEVKFNFDDKY